MFLILVLVLVLNLNFDNFYFIPVFFDFFLLSLQICHSKTAGTTNQYRTKKKRPRLLKWVIPSRVINMDQSRSYKDCISSFSFLFCFFFSSISFFALEPFDTLNRDWKKMD